MGKKTTNTNNTNAVPPATRAAKPTPKSQPAIVPAAPEVAVAVKRKAIEPAAAKPAIVPAVPEVAVAAKRKPTVAVAAKRTRKPAGPKTTAYTQEDVALRAYFIAEKRHGAGLPGDSHQDWIEAERQLALERGAKKPKLKQA